jgi:hypothetical protein
MIPDVEEETIYSKAIVCNERSSYTMPVTYTWQNIEAQVEIVQGNIFNKRTTRNRILDCGNLCFSKASLYYIQQ